MRNLKIAITGKTSRFLNLVKNTHKLICEHLEAAGAWIKIIFTLILALYLPVMAGAGAFCAKELDEKAKNEVARFGNSSYVSTILSAQHYIVKSLPVLGEKSNADKAINDQNNILKLLESYRNMAINDKFINLNYNTLKYKAYEIVILVMIATGSLQLGIVIAESSSKIKRVYMLYFGTSIGIVGIIIAIHSGFALARLFDLIIEL